jgi:predicted phosphodiesterase
VSYNDDSIKYLKVLREETGLDWVEITEAWNEKFADQYGSKTLNALRKTYRRYQDDDITDDVLIKNMQTAFTAKKTASKLRKENKALTEDSISSEAFLSELLDINKKAPIKYHKKVKLIKSKKVARTIVAHVSDTHIGCNIHKDEQGGANEYNPTIAARRFALYFKTLAEYKVDHRDETDLVLVLNGDIFAGIIHNQESVDPMSTQFSSALRIFTQGISYLAQHFKNITVVCTSGNHDRFITKTDKGRQMDQKWDSFTTMLYSSLQQGFRDYKSIEFIIPESPYARLLVQGHWLFITHGDTVINLGNPSKSINVEAITNQVNNFITGSGVDIDVLMVGHVHKELFFTLNNGVSLAINGTLSGNDSFSQSIGYLVNRSCQQFFEMTPEFKMGDMRFVDLTAADDDKSLEKIIEPLKGKF